MLATVRAAAPGNRELAAAIVGTQRLIKGYGDTFARGLASFTAIANALPRIGTGPEASARVDALVDAALADEDGIALRSALAGLDRPVPVAAFG